MSNDSTGKEIRSILIDYPFDLPEFATVSLKDRWKKLLTKVDVKEKFNNKIIFSNNMSVALSNEKRIYLSFSRTG